MAIARFLVLLVCLLPLSAGYILPITPALAQIFVQGLAGAFSNDAQVQADTRFHNIDVWYRPMEKASLTNGIKQLVAERLGSSCDDSKELFAWPFLTASAIRNQGNEPYKKNVVVVVNRDGRIHLQSFRLREEIRDEYTGMAQMGSVGLLRGIDAGCLEHLAPGCDMLVSARSTGEGLKFEGKFECQRGCRFLKGKNDGRTYLKSKLEEGVEVYLDSKIEVLLSGEGSSVQHYSSSDNFRVLSTDEEFFPGEDKGPYLFQKKEIWTPDFD